MPSKHDGGEFVAEEDRSDELGVGWNSISGLRPANGSEGVSKRGISV